MMPRLAVVIVSYNVRDLLRGCLRTLFATAGGLDLTVVVVDNASHDGSAAMVADEFPQVDLLAEDENLGFTGGNNLALRHLGFRIDSPSATAHTPDEDAPPSVVLPDFVLLLNPDTEVTPGSLQQMVDCLLDHPDAGACGARLTYGDGTFQHGAFIFPGLSQVLIDFFPLTGLPGAHRLHNSRLNGRYPQTSWAGSRPFPVDFVLGAALMMRPTTIQAVGGLDDAYFMYCEEMDWCMRLRDAGWRTYAVPTARIIHHEGQSSRQVRWTSFVRLWRSRYRFYSLHARHYPPGFVPLLRRLVRWSLRGRMAVAHRRFARGEIDGAALAQELAAYATVMKM